MIKVKVTVTKNRNSVSCSITLVCFGLLTPDLLMGSLYQDAFFAIATQVSVIKVKVTVTKNRNSVSAK